MSKYILLLPLILGYLLDLILGDPAFLPHPVRFIGRLIQVLERILRKSFPKTKAGERAAGFILALTIPGICLAATTILLILAAKIHIAVYLALETLLCYQLLATRNLRDESMNVCHKLVQNELAAARQAVGRIVGRDTDTLSEKQIIMASVETVSENTTDGVIAPMLFLCFGGAWGMFYKAVNTLDSMVGYKNEKYRFFGTASAWLDDICNFVPARLAALFMLLTSLLPGFDFRSAMRIFKRDRKKHASPNSAQTEAVCAGALQIQLGGGASYGGVFSEKPTLGDDTRTPAASDIRLANRLMLLTSLLALLIFGTVKAFILRSFL